MSVWWSHLLTVIDGAPSRRGVAPFVSIPVIYTAKNERQLCFRTSARLTPSPCTIKLLTSEEQQSCNNTPAVNNPTARPVMWQPSTPLPNCLIVRQALSLLPRPAVTATGLTPAPVIQECLCTPLSWWGSRCDNIRHRDSRSQGGSETHFYDSRIWDWYLQPSAQYGLACTLTQTPRPSLVPSVSQMTHTHTHTNLCILASLNTHTHTLRNAWHVHTAWLFASLTVLPSVFFS